MTIGSELQGLDTGELTLMARRALGSDSAEIAEWSICPLSYDCTNPTSGGVFRVSGIAVDSGRSVHWSLIVQVLRSPAGMVMPNGAMIPRDLPDDPTVFGYWRREALTYQSGLLDDLPGRLIAPRCFGVSMRTSDSAWLWLEEVAEERAPCWTEDGYRRAARDLGLFNGAYLSGRRLPDDPWLGPDWLRSWLDLAGDSMMGAIGVPDAWAHPLVRHACPNSMALRVMQLWSDRATFLAALDSLPHTFCHRDAFRSNVMTEYGHDGEDRTVVIDWGFAGAGPIGEEIAPLITMRPAGTTENFEPWDLETGIYDGYVEGVREAGSGCDERLIRFGFAATAALRYTIPTVVEILCDARDESRHAEIECRRGRPIDRALRRQAALTDYLLDLADKARSLLPFVSRAGVESQEGAA